MPFIPNIPNGLTAMMMRTLTINGGILCSYDWLTGVVGGNVNRHYLSVLVVFARKMLASGRIENVVGQGYIYFPEEA